MIALFALLGLVTAPALVLVPCRRLAARARAAGVRKGDREAGVALVRRSEAATVVAGLAVGAASVLALCVLAVRG